MEIYNNHTLFTELLLSRTIVFDSRTGPEDVSAKYQTYTFTRALDNVSVETTIFKLEQIYEEMQRLCGNYLTNVDKYPEFYNAIRGIIRALYEQAESASSIGLVHVYGNHPVKRWVTLGRDDCGEVDCMDIEIEDCPNTGLLIDEIIHIAGYHVRHFNVNSGKMVIYIGEDFKKIDACIPEYDIYYD